ncbi:protocatechuate 3,4-dioxygenase [Pendulispora brunnea]|uniref:Protocatechuate 3,4-dioxygenase n=1 Tax=Pendulispora brunnea TaxID=2905690 RepID=A0ABZ2KE30_9BACT
MSSDFKYTAFRRDVTRRQALRLVGSTLAIAPLAQWLIGCASEEGKNSGPVAWASGGTAAMRGGYPDPFSTGLGATCKLTCKQNLGPCYSAVTSLREDISEGEPGLPTRFAFLVIDEQCRPVPDAIVDVWHASAEGLYSGEGIAEEPHGEGNLEGCVHGDTRALRSRWFRGQQRTNSSGRADFNSCFPGWYSRRTIHVHAIVRIAEVESETVQLYFDDALNDQIVGTQPIYNARGPRDSTNATDIVGSRIGAELLPDYLFQTRQMADGALLAWKTLVVRASGVDVCRVGARPA